MKFDLFATGCFDHLTTSFGIYDDPDLPEEPVKKVSYDEGVAKIENKNNRSIYFVPVDKNIICYKPNSKDIESQCDALLICLRPQAIYDLYFVELKNVRKDWITDGIEQLKTSISNLTSVYSVACISKKMAFLANGKHPYYHFSLKEKMEKFRNETGFRLNICAEITIK
ncbi:MAG: hypothetical protein LBP72_06510 [Dysgonamonadaceae bacterium]|jgi:hypothetical protein|nr:hypothetical protein [Dysgonamonadaceae bacterium]